MSVNKLVGELVGTRTGPVLVVGGAPSVPAELATLRKGGFRFEDCLIVSANEHAIRAGLKPDYAVVNDNIHSTLKVHQEPRMRKLMPDTKLLSRHWWADYRSPNLLPCNSGLKAILYAAILGANPVVVIGIQHYRTGLYFHEAEGHDARGKNPNLAREMGHFTKQTTDMRKLLGGVPIRAVSGPLAQVWAPWDPEESFAPRPLSELERNAVDALPARYLRVEEPGFGFEGATIPEGMVFAATPREAEQLKFNEAVVDVSHWDLSDQNTALQRHLAARHAEQARYMELIGKVRGSRRGVSRSLYDGDFIRMIRWFERGESPTTIGQRLSLPRQQVEFVLQTMELLPKQ